MGSRAPCSSRFRRIAEECSAEEWQARVDLAAAHRLAVMHGFHEGIFNHLTLRCPAAPTATTRSRSACTGRR